RDFHVTGVQTCALPISQQVDDAFHNNCTERDVDRRALKFVEVVASRNLAAAGYDKVDEVAYHERQETGHEGDTMSGWHEQHFPAHSPQDMTPDSEGGHYAEPYLVGLTPGIQNVFPSVLAFAD